jgi:hypothetical protein
MPQTALLKPKTLKAEIEKPKTKGWKAEFGKRKPTNGKQKTA